MYRHSPNRNHKSKGFRLKHVLQICVLVSVCFWLIYQVKHSYDKRKFFDENDAKTSRDVEMNNAVLKFGRKDLNPQEKGPDKDLESHDEEIVEEDKNEEEIVEEEKNEEEIVEEDKNEEETGEETEGEDKHEEETGEEDKNEEETGEDKHEEETGEQDKHEEENEEEDKHEEETGVEEKHEKEEQVEYIETEEKGVEGREDGDDSVNEQEQEKTDSDVNQGEEFIDEEKDKEDTDEKQIEDKDDDVKDSQEKNDSSIEDHDHDEGSRNTREAREEQYKGDDASSAVTHDGHITSTENLSGSMENQASTVEPKSKNNITDDGNTGQYTTEDLEAAGNGNSTSDEEKSSKVLDSFSQGNSSLTSITALESNGQSDTINNTGTQDLSIKNGTEIIMSDLSQSQSVTDGNITAAEGANFETLVMEQSDNSTVALGNTNLNSNSSSSTEIKNVEENPVESTDSSMNSEIVSLETLAQSNVSAENKDDSESTTIVETTNEVGNENAENIKRTEGTYENSNSSNTEDTDEVQHNSIDSSELSVPVDDRENHIDLGTLPDIRTEGSNSEGVSEE